MSVCSTDTSGRHRFWQEDAVPLRDSGGVCYSVRCCLFQTSRQQGFTVTDSSASCLCHKYKWKPGTEKVTLLTFFAKLCDWWHHLMQSAAEEVSSVSVPLPWLFVYMWQQWSSELFVPAIPAAPHWREVWMGHSLTKEVMNSHAGTDKLSYYWNQ